MITASVAQIKADVEREFAADFAAGRLYQLGVYNRRPIAGTSTWSQHSWGNAWDIGVKDPTTGDRVHSYLAAKRLARALPIGTILWRVRNHFDHIHVEGVPKQTGTPPPAGSRTEGETVTVLQLQTALRKAGYDPGPLDGKFGPLTEAAWIESMRSAGGSGPDMAALIEAVLMEIRRRLG